MRKGRLILLLTFCVFLLSCEHDNIENLLGPDLDQSGLLCVPDGFEIKFGRSETKTIDFKTSPAISEEYDLSNKVTWEYGVIGTNGAVYTGNGFGDKLLFNWDGSTRTGFFFKKGDTVKSYFLFNCLDTIWGDKYVIEETKVYEQTLLSDFDGNGILTSWNNASNQLKLVNSVANDSAAAQGEKYLLLIGQDFGLGSYLGQVIAGPSPRDFDLSEPADKVFLNAMVRGSANASVEFRLYEGDGDRYEIVVPVTWKGWKLVSIPYSDFIAFTDKDEDGQTPDDITQFRITVRSDDPDPEVILNIDYISFTQGKPLQP